ncbi:MAG: phosphoglucosamine mutase [Clostridiales bacterium]|nr:phosphoglucosamine mutase [Clostridiales bacterium]
MGKYFGTDGFRGEANVGLTSEHAYQIGKFIGWFYGARLGRKARIVIGKDTRRSSYMFEYSIVAGLTSTGADAYMLHVTTTPSVAYVTRVDSFDCGVMISASHNPFYDNGIKLINSRGEKMDDETTDAIEAYLDGNLAALGLDSDVPAATREELGCIVDYVSGRNRYVGYLISLAAHSYKNVRVGLDCANGSAWNIARTVFEALGAKTYVINAEPDGQNINRNAGSTHIDGLRRFVLENHLDVGFAYDGDADRCLAVDENGEVVDGDKIMYIFARQMKKEGKLRGNKVVTTVMSNFGLYKALDEENIGYEKTAVGDRFVYENMVKNGYCVGGEQSGHIILSKYATTGDGILTSIELMEAMLDSKQTLSRLAAPMTTYPQVLKNVRVSDKAAVRENAHVQEVVRRVGERLGDTGRVLLRESGTEPVIRVMAEAEEERIAEQCVNEMIDAMKAEGLA